MKYIFELNSRVHENEPIDIKHNKFIDALKQMDGDWGIDPVTACPIPTFGKEIIAISSLRKKLRGNIKGDIIYRFRRLTEDDHGSDDRIYIEINHEKIDAALLIDKVLPCYVEAFDGYAASIYPYSLNKVIDDIPFGIKKNLNYRKNLAFFCPFHFMDDILVKNVFNLSLTQFSEKLRGEIYNVEIINNGVYLKASDKFINENEALEFNLKMQQLTGKHLP